MKSSSVGGEGDGRGMAAVRAGEDGAETNGVSGMARPGSGEISRLPPRSGLLGVTTMLAPLAGPRWTNALSSDDGRAGGSRRCGLKVLGSIDGISSGSSTCLRSSCEDPREGVFGSVLPLVHTDPLGRSSDLQGRSGRPLPLPFSSELSRPVLGPTVADADACLDEPADDGGKAGRSGERGRGWT